MRRRDFITGIAGSATTWPLAVRAQQAQRMRRIGILLFTKQDLAVINPMLRGLEALGYVNGKTVAIEYRYADGEYERLPEAADELVRLNPDVIFFIRRRTGPNPKESDDDHSDRRGGEQRSSR